MKFKDACSLEESYDKPRHILKSRDITLPTKVHLVKAMVFPVVMNGCESWTIKKVEHQIIDAFKLWCWRRDWTAPWTARRSNLSIVKEINPEYSLEWRRQWQPTPVLLPGKSHGWRSLVGYSLWGREESDTYEATSLSLFTFMHWRRKWQPTPVFLPEESQGWWSLVGCHLWGHTESDTTIAT